MDININTLEELLENFEKGNLENEGDKLSELNNKNIILYGAGNIGKRLYKNLKENNLNVCFFLDRSNNIDNTKYEIPIYHPEDKKLSEFKEDSYVILSALFSVRLCDEIKLELHNLGFKNVFALHEVNLSLVNNGAFYESLFNGSYNKIDIFGKDKNKILRAFDLLETEYDKKIYIDYVKAHLTMDFTRFSKPHDIEMQYLAHDIDKEKNYSYFIDCGGFDGDTIRNLLEKQIRIDSVAVFEPQNDLCAKIAAYTKENSDKFNSVTLFPCGVYSKTEKFRFSSSNDAPSTGKLDEFGSDIVQCVAIDDVLQGFKPTFIKMDIEGAEVEALKGAKNTIEKYHPQLAICVYHSLSDVWEIPLLINQFYDGYRFYLRSYNYMGLETVLYAFPE